MSSTICRQFWKAGNYNDGLGSKATFQNGKNYLHVHPMFLHSNATSHKWVFGAIAELLDNAVDEVDYEFNPTTETLDIMHGREHFMSNLSLLLQWSPYSTEAELLKQVSAMYNQCCFQFASRFENGILVESNNASGITFLMLALTCNAAITKLGQAKVSCPQFFLTLPDITSRLDGRGPPIFTNKEKKSADSFGLMGFHLSTKSMKHPTIPKVPYPPT